MNNALIFSDQSESHTLAALLPEGAVKLHCCASPSEAFARLKSLDAVFIVIDTAASIFDPFELAALIRENELYAGIPIVFTGNIFKPQMSSFKGFEKGLIEFIKRPYRTADLLFKTKILLSLYNSVKQRKLSYQKEVQSSERIVKILQGLDKLSIVATTNLKGDITFVNDRFCKISGYSREELLGANHRILSSGLHPSEFFKDMWSTISKGEVWHAEVCNRRKNGSLYWVDTSITRINGINGVSEPQYMAIRTDITAQKEAQKQLIQSSKMSSLGEMAGGIAHEINNPLAIIFGKAELLKDLILEGGIDQEKIKECLSKIEKTAERIAKIIKGLRAFSRNAEKDPLIPARVATIVEDTLELCKEKFKDHGIELRVNSSLDTLIECRPSQISQILVNLLGNAHDAVENLPNKWVAIDLILENDNIKIIVTDSGNGIPNGISDKIMDPFFTTKDIGKGTGLGLSISKGIAEDHHGSLTYNAKSKNTSFVLQLPVKQKKQ